MEILDFYESVYEDLESSIDEQQEEFATFGSDRRHSVILRTKLSVRWAFPPAFVYFNVNSRVHACIEKLYNTRGRELRRALFSLKQIFADDEELVHEFVARDGLTCLFKVGAEADQNYQNYILRALGQIMIYVDGMNRVADHIETLKWLYSLLASRVRMKRKVNVKGKVKFLKNRCISFWALVLTIVTEKRALFCGQENHLVIAPLSEVFWTPCQAHASRGNPALAAGNRIETDSHWNSFF